MKKIRFLAIALALLCLALTGCDTLLGGSSSNSDKYEQELVSATGKWVLHGDEDTYFILDGSKGAMTFSYTEDGVEKQSGSFGAVHRGNGDDVLTPLTLMLKIGDTENWLGCYVENFEESFTQFTVMEIEKDLGFIDGTVYAHRYRLSELPYKLGTYVLEGNELKSESNNYADADEYNIPAGTYTTESGESITFVFTKPRSTALFRYVKGDVTVEGVCTVASDKGTVYLYIDHEPYEKVRKADREHYDTTFSNYYPPDFYLRGDFDANDGSIEINGLYRHTYTQTEIKDEVWTFGIYTK